MNGLNFQISTSVRAIHVKMAVPVLMPSIGTHARVDSDSQGCIVNPVSKLILNTALERELLVQNIVYKGYGL